MEGCSRFLVHVPLKFCNMVRFRSFKILFELFFYKSFILFDLKILFISSGFSLFTFYFCISGKKPGSREPQYAF